ncbi:hypothetical protein [Actinospica robiniae]|uniref:hypothetical protein n=1 Tax=Actinospica robiniae TaxID=304901 RepID=UPI00040A499F|nr:hypothetical protein [Actinospica robiniae]
MNNPAAITAVIARPRAGSWEGRYVLAYGAPVDLGPLLHRLARDAHAARGTDGITALAAALIDEHVCWEEIAPTHERLGACRCHTPEPVAVTGLDAQMLTPGQPRTARYAYLLTPAGLRVEVRVNGDWLKLGRASYTRETGRIRFDLMAERARELREAHAWDTDPAN